jgi:hypothetical protein
VGIWSLATDAPTRSIGSYFIPIIVLVTIVLIGVVVFWSNRDP